MKLSKKMEETMHELINAETERCGLNKFWILPDGTEKHYHCWHNTYKSEDGLIHISGHTNTLKALEFRGLIEIVKIGGERSDIVRLIKNENIRKPLEEEYHLKKFKIDHKQWSNRTIFALSEEHVRHWLKKRFMEKCHIEQQG